jgi:hypothetical protein
VSPVFAVDFGTSHIAVAIRVGGRVRLVKFDDETRTPSCVFWHADQRVLVAGRLARSERDGAPEHYLRTPKRNIDDEVVLLGDRLVKVIDIVAAVLLHALETARDQAPPQVPDEIRLTHPAAWSPARLNLLRAAGHQALAELGWSDVPIQLLAEPVAAAVEAAASHEIAVGKALAVYDLGGGTFDAAVVRRTATGFEVIGMPDGQDGCGGERFDELLLEDLHKRAGGRAGWEHAFLSPMPDAALRGARLLLRDRMTESKEWLSEDMDVDIKIPPPQECGEQLRRVDFDALIRHDIENTIAILLETIERAKRTAGLRDDEFAGIVLTGGSSRIPLVSTMLRDRVANMEPLPQTDRKGAVAAGAARWSPQANLASSPSPNGAGGAAAHDAPVDPYSAREFRTRLAVKLGSNWRHREARVELGTGDLVVRDYPCDFKHNDRWAELARKGLAKDTVMGNVTPALVAGVEHGRQAWLLESGTDGTAVKRLERFALQRTEAGDRAVHIVGREEAAELVGHVRFGEARLPSREFEHTPLVVRVPAGKPVLERVNIVPRRRLRGRADFDVFAESSEVPDGTSVEEWTRRVLARFADAEPSIATVEDTFLDGTKALRNVVRLKTPTRESSSLWWCLWTGVVDGRGVAVGVESANEVRLDRAAPYRDLFVLAEA